MVTGCAEWLSREMHGESGAFRIYSVRRGFSQSAQGRDSCFECRPFASLS